MHFHQENKPLQVLEFCSSPFPKRDGDIQARGDEYVARCEQGKSHRGQLEKVYNMSKDESEVFAMYSL